MHEWKKILRQVTKLQTLNRLSRVKSQMNESFIDRTVLEYFEKEVK